MSINRIAGADPNTGVIFTSRAAAELDAARNTGINTGGLYSPHTEVVERRAAVAGDPDACVKMIKLAHRDAPHGLEKSESVVIDAKPEPTRQLSETERITGPTHVTALIKAAHGDPGFWDPFAADQNIAKLLQSNVGFGEHGELFTENGRTLVRVSKAA